MEVEHEAAEDLEIWRFGDLEDLETCLSRPFSKSRLLGGRRYAFLSALSTQASRNFPLQAATCASMFSSVICNGYTSAHDTDDSDDETLSARWQRKCSQSSGAEGTDAVPQQIPQVPEYLKPVEGEGEELRGDAYRKRAYRFRERANVAFAHLKRTFLDSPDITSEMRSQLQPYCLTFDKARSRRGVCHYRRKLIALSAVMVDRGVRADKIYDVLRHELTHAALPAAGHGQRWKELNRKMGGTGERCCTDDETAAKIGFKVILACSNAPDMAADPQTGSDGHCLMRRQKRPSTGWLRGRQCAKCAHVGAVHTLKVYWCP